MADVNHEEVILGPEVGPLRSTFQHARSHSFILPTHHVQVVPEAGQGARK